MSIVCQDCRRLVRDMYIYRNEGNYFCQNCQATYKLPRSFYNRDDLAIPLLQRKTDLKVRKSEDELLIELPVHIFTLMFKIAFGFFVLSSFLVFNLIKDEELTSFPYLFLFPSGVFILTLINVLGKRSILVTDNKISYVKKIFGLNFVQEEKLVDVVRIREIEVEVDGNSGPEISSRFVEVFFKDRDSWEFGHNLDKKDRHYIIAELKLYHFYNQTT